MLSDLVRGAEPEIAGPTGLSGLVQGAAAPRMSLPAALNAMRAGRLQPPRDGEIGGLVAADMPAQPTPRPPPLEPSEDELRARTDVLEMRNRIAAKKRALETVELPTRDVRTAVTDAQRKHEARRKLDELERQLMNGETDG